LLSRFILVAVEVVNQPNSRIEGIGQVAFAQKM